MYVIKRNGKQESVHFDKITRRIVKLSQDLSNVDPVLITQKATSSLYEGVTTSEIDEHTASISAALVTKHLDYSTLAARLSVSNLQKNLPKSFSETMLKLYQFECPQTKEKRNLISETLYLLLKDESTAKKIDSAIKPDRDFFLDYFGFNTLRKNYFLKLDGTPTETYQYLLMRVSLGVHITAEALSSSDSLAAKLKIAFKTYDLLSQQKYTLATPTLFNAGTFKPQLASCFLATVPEDSVNGIYEAIDRAAQVSKHAGGLGLAVSNIRAAGSPVNGVNGEAKGLIGFLSVLNATMRYVDQGGARRPGACCVYVEPWHADVMAFLELRKNTGNEASKCRDLFQAFFLPDLFMQKVEEDADWHLFCPYTAPGLQEVVGDDFIQLYTKYVKEHKFRETMKARKLMKEIVRTQIETGGPFILFKDTCNRLSNQKKLGTIKLSNLCTEIVEFADTNEVAVCNLASVNLSVFVSTTSKDRKGDEKFPEPLPEDVLSYFDFVELRKVVKHIVKVLDTCIDINFYSLKEAALSNKRHRPIGLGVQGLADVFCLLKIAFDSEAARLLNVRIFESIYFAALESSCELAEERGVYESYSGCPVSEGVLHFDYFAIEKEDWRFSGLLDWTGLRKRIAKNGLRNSLLTCCMPTASTAQLLGNVESIEPATSNLYSRRVSAGDFVYVNPHLLRDLSALGLWNETLKNKILALSGSIQDIPEIPENLKAIYKTAWELSQKRLVEMAADRALFIDQSQSLNIFMKEPSLKKLVSLHMFSWKSKLKTGMYYLRTQAATDAIKFTVNKKAKVSDNS